MAVSVCIFPSIPVYVTEIISSSLPVPLIVGVVSVTFSSLSSVLSVFPLIAVISGESGAVKSIVIFAGVATDSFPAGSVAVTLIGTSFPSGISEVIWTSKLPSSSTIAESLWVLPSSPTYVTSIVSPASPLPFITGVLSAVFSSSTIGASGAIESILTFPLICGDSFPAGSVAVTTIFTSPSSITEVICTAYVPSSSTVAVSVCSFPCASVYATVIVAPGSPLPVIIGVLSLVVNSSTVGASGAILSIVIILGSVFSDSFPALSVVVAVSACVPSDNTSVSITTTIGSSNTSSSVNVYVPTGSLAEYIVITSPTSGFGSLDNVTYTVGVSSFVYSSIVFLSSSLSAIASGVSGAVVSSSLSKDVSIVTSIGSEWFDLFPNLSSTFTVNS